MTRFIFSVVPFILFAFVYFGVFSSNVEAGNGPPYSVAPTPDDCGVICAGVTDPCDGATTPCLCTTDPCEGTDGDDIICGSSSGEEIRAGDGDDRVCAGGGNDWLRGGHGCDDLQGEGGMDELDGGHCADSHSGGAAAEGDICDGGWGLDSFTGCDGDMSEGKEVDHKTQGECVSARCGNI